ncbi:MAG: tetratricopeptide repeat protein, partial [Deltaproteobacteria bacterium]|nr:tetratricopeptide repeat protein [Deltaproteobacteria bacterium]
KLAAVARKGGRMDEAARYLGRARAIDPDDHALRRDLAETQLSSNRVEEGISELFGLADVFLSESDPAEGFKILDRIAELAPDDAARHIEIGRCLEAAGYDEKAVEGFATFVKRVQKAGRHEDALAVCKEARRLAPRNEFFIEAAMESLMAAGRKTEAVTVLRDAARSLMEVENWRAAEAMLGRAAKIDRTDPGIKTDMAEILERAGRTEDAVRLWREVAQTHRAAENSEQTLIAARQMLRLDPANVEAKAMLAEALEATGETREALELWKESVATLLQRDANSGPALKVLEHILTLAPDDMMMIAQTAQLKFRVLGADKAKPAFDLWIEKARRTLDPKLLLLALQSSVEAYPKEIAWRSHLAELLIAREQSAEAIPHLESLLAAYKLLGKEDGDYRRILDQLVALCPDRLDLRVEWADALAKGGEVKRALEIFDEIARQYLARGDQEHGLQLLQRSLKYQPENREILLRAAELLERLNRRPEAIAAYEQLVDLSRRLDTWRSNVAAIDKLLMLCPDRHDLRLELAQAYESHGDIENAVDQYHRVAQALVKKDIKGNQTLEICERLVMIAPPEMRAAREMLVDCYLARKDIEKAKGELERMGDQALREGDLNRGESIFRRIQEIDPQDIGSGERLGKLYEAKGQTEQAADAYRQVLALYEKKKDVPRIISVLGHLKGLAPKDLDLRMRLAQTLATLPERADETAEEFYELIALAIGQEKPNIARAALKEAEPFFEERWDFRFKTIQLFTRAQEAPKTIKAWKTFAEQALAAGQNAMAREAATEGIQLAPADIQLLEVRIQANQRLNDVDAAEADLLTMARQNTSEGKHAKAEASLNRALELKPNDINMLGLLAQSQVSQQHLDQAVA